MRPVSSWSTAFSGSTPYLHFLVTEGGVDASGVFQKILRIDDSRLAEIFAREGLSFLVGLELLSPEWAERIFLCDGRGRTEWTANIRWSRMFG
jgi:hypothetical protein